MANKTLTATVKLETKSAEASLKKLAKLIDNVQKSVDKTTKANNKLDGAINKAVTATNKLNTATKKVLTTTEKAAATAEKVNNANKRAATSARQMSAGYNSSTTAANRLLKVVRSIAATYLGIMGIRAVLTTSDTITSAENRLNNMDGGNSQLTQTSMDKIYSASMRSRSGYGDMLSNVSKSMTLAGDAFGGNIDNAIKFQEIMSKAYTVGGASAAEQASSMYQLIQALGAGVLQGDELRSVREGAPIAYKAIEKFAQGVLDTDKSLKELASQGEITSDIVVAAIMGMDEGVDNINDKFANTSMTFAQAGVMIANMATQAFRPVLQMLNDMLNSTAGQAFITGLGQAFVFLANIILWVSTLLGAFFNWLATNWYWVQFIVYGVMAAIIVYFAIMAAQAIWAGLMAFDAFILGLSPLYAWIVVIGFLLATLTLLTGSVEETCGLIVGSITAAVSIVWNLFVTLVTLILKSAILPITNALDAFANFFGNLFNDPITSIVRLFEGLADSVLSILQTIAGGIDAIFGTDLASGVQGWRNSLSSYADRLVEKYGNGSYEQKSAVTDIVDSALTGLQNTAMWNTSDAFNTGHDWGTSGAEWVSETLGGIGDYLKSYNDENTLVGGSYLPDINGAENALNTGDFSNALGDIGDINDNTSAMKDSMDLTQEDLDYLRRIADMEWKKEYTTASITVDMSNYNTISGDGDLNGIVTKLVDTLYDELNILADGVYE